MLDNYIGKKVRVLVSSGSGAGTISSGQRYSNGVVTSVINFYGVIRKLDDKFVELESVKYSLYNLDVEKPIALGYPVNIEMSIFESESTLININSVISISLI